MESEMIMTKSEGVFLPRLGQRLRDKQAELLALNRLKKQLCYCSRCGKELQFRSFRVHTCFKAAVERYGKREAKLRIRRLDRPPIEQTRRGSKDESAHIIGLYLPFCSCALMRFTHLGSDTDD